MWQSYKHFNPWSGSIWNHNLREETYPWGGNPDYLRPPFVTIATLMSLISWKCTMASGEGRSSHELSSTSVISSSFPIHTAPGAQHTGSNMLVGPCAGKTTHICCFAADMCVPSWIPKRQSPAGSSLLLHQTMQLPKRTAQIGTRADDPLSTFIVLFCPYSAALTASLPSLPRNIHAGYTPRTSFFTTVNHCSSAAFLLWGTASLPNAWL